MLGVIKKIIKSRKERKRERQGIDNDNVRVTMKRNRIETR